MYYVYAIRSKIKKYTYIGMTNDPERRIREHNNGREGTTRSYAPFESVLIEECGDRMTARAREKYLKTGVGREYLKNL